MGSAMSRKKKDHDTLTTDFEVDGIDEAFGSHGGVMPKDVARLCALCGGDPVLLARAIAAAALQGPIDDPSVDGGRDNVAVLVARP